MTASFLNIFIYIKQDTQYQRFNYFNKQTKSNQPSKTFFKTI